MSLALAVMCLISTGIERPLRIVIPAVVMVQATFFGMFALVDDESLDGSVFGVFCGTAGAAGLGIAIRSQRQYINAINERALHAEETRDAESRRRISEERMRIARDLHDAVAHHIAVVSMYTGLARTTLTTSVEQTEAALAKAQEATRTVLTEMQQIVHILRDTETNGVNSREPAPDFSSIEELTSSFHDSGVQIDFHVQGQPGAMTTATGLVVYRVLQEALTNAHKYGDGRAEVEITFGDRWITIVVTNHLPISATSSVPGERGSGHGLIGMRERVRLIDGSLNYAFDTGKFVLKAELPWNPHRATTEVARGAVVLESRND